MRKITEQAARAFRSDTKLKSGNTEVVITDDGLTRLYLFGNLIAERRKDGVYITNAGWNSNTTMERLRGLGADVCIKKGRLHLNGSPWNGKWAKISSQGIGGKEDGGDSLTRSVGMVMALGSILFDNKKDANAFKTRIAKAGFGEGIDLPDDWDQLSEDEKERRLNGATDILLDKPEK